MTSLRDLILRKRSEILGLFVARVMHDGIAAPPSGTPRSELVDHLPSFLDALAVALDKAQTVTTGLAPDVAAPRADPTGADPTQVSLLSSAGEEHGLQRLRLGFDVEAVVREYGVLRECILEVVDQECAEISVREFAELSRCVDVGTAHAVREYSFHKSADVDKAMRAREEILAIVSHDLRTPLNAIMMSTHLLASRFQSQTREYEVIGAIRRSADQMNAMIRDLLDLASLDAGAPKLDIAPEAPLALVEEALASFTESAIGRQIAMRINCPEDLPNVLCDRASIRRVLANLVENALKFSTSGSDIDVKAATCGAFVRFEVHDGGSGIPPELRDHIFERFVRSTDAARRGTGLGLYIARGLVEAHRGEIGVESAVAKGSTFWFTLPTKAA